MAPDPRPKFQKAYIQLVQPKPDSLSATSGGQDTGLGIVHFAFNPKEFTFKKAANWQSTPARGSSAAPTPQFTGSGPSQVSVEVFLDNTIHDRGPGEAPPNSVSDDVKTLLKTVKPLPDTVGQNKPSPPMVIFGWGSEVIITGIVKTVSVKYTLFTPEGVPLRASCTVAIEELPSENPPQNPTSGALAVRRTHTMVDGDTLQSVAYQEYGRPTYWRALAEANDIDDPLGVRPGTHLLVPPVEDVVSRARS